MAKKYVRLDFVVDPNAEPPDAAILRDQAGKGLNHVLGAAQLQLARLRGLSMPDKGAIALFLVGSGLVTKRALGIFLMRSDGAPASAEYIRQARHCAIERWGRECATAHGQALFDEFCVNCLRGVEPGLLTLLRSASLRESALKEVE